MHATLSRGASEWDDDDGGEGENEGRGAELDAHDAPKPPPPPTAKPIPLNPNIVAFNSQAGLALPCPPGVVAAAAARSTPRRLSMDSDWDEPPAAASSPDRGLGRRVLSGGLSDEDEEARAVGQGADADDQGASGSQSSGRRALPPIPDPPSRSGSQRRKQLTSAHSFAILSPRAREAMALDNLGRLATVMHRLVGHKEKDQFEDVVETYTGRQAWVYQDMGLPLAHYLLASGHNSYLTGNQFTSKSSVKPITEALSAGCRVIEIDVWNGKHEPKVLHGFTMTAPVSFLKCARGIRKHAFVASAFPLIITLENHCNQKNKRRIVEIVNEELGDMIHTRSRPWRHFPSPASLCGRILIRDKNDGAELEEGSARLSHRNATHWRNMLEDGKVELQELSRLITIVNCKHPSAVRSPVAVSSSRGESHFDELLQSWHATVVHTQHHLLRTYPAAKRVDSSNYDPFVPWSFGAQIVAMNWQTPGPPLWAYRGMFSDNGGCGYVRKPPFLLASNPLNPNDREPQVLLCVRLLSARHMRHRTVCDNMVDVAVWGVAKDVRASRSSPRRAFDCCTWDQEFTFPLRCPELAVLAFTLSYEYLAKERLGGQACIPINNLSEGRFEVPLLGGHGNKRRGSRRHMCVVVELKTQKVTGNLRRLLE